MTVRRCVPGDAGEIFRLVDQWVAACPVDYPPPMKEVIDALVTHGAADNHFVVLVSEGVDGGLNGVLAAYSQPFAWNPTVSQAVLLLIYVEDGKNKAKASLELLNMFHNAAKNSGCAEVSFTFSSGNREEETIRFFRRLDYDQIGVDLRKPL
jgi:hypothetical protein